jgi:hypothetical protein
MQMKNKTFFFIITMLMIFANAKTQNNRIGFNGKQIFLSGSNIAWIDFGADTGPGETDFAGFKSIFEEAHHYGGNCMRLWLHTNGSVTPEFSGNSVIGPGEGTISDLGKILDLAYAEDMGLILCLWSFDMLRKKYGETIINRNKALLTVDSIMESYIKNALMPMVDSLKNHPGIIAWEIFNEPEGMCHDVHWGGWDFCEHVSIANIQRFVNKCAAAIHHINPLLKVTNGDWSLISATDSGGYTNYYTDERLIAAGGEKDGTLDFYTVHHYDWLDDSPFMHPCNDWGWDKPVVIAEFFPQCKNCGPFSNYEDLYNNGFAGALGWDWRGKSGAEIRKEMQHMFTSYPDDISIISSPEKKERE